jgi:hypothetical protein
MAIAMRASVTVSMLALSKGMLSLIFLVRKVETLTSLGTTKDLPGINSTSSKVRPVLANLSSMVATPPFLAEIFEPFYHPQLDDTT